ncbi:hypothetical protein Ddc_14676 [Ditylenchus destructor]|nr:hypothetical protein Ddc_14676 [Ditylenchus destructor]
MEKYIPSWHSGVRNRFTPTQVLLPLSKTDVCKFVCSLQAGQLIVPDDADHIHGHLSFAPVVFTNTDHECGYISAACRHSSMAQLS